MLLLFLSFFSNYNLFNCNQDGQQMISIIDSLKNRLADGSSSALHATKNNHNNTPLTVLIHKSIHDIDTLLKDFQLEIQKEKSVLRSVDLEENFKEDLGLFDYSITPMWWHDTSGNDTAGQYTPDATFLPTPEGFGETTTSTTVASTKLNNLWASLNSLPGIFYDSSTPGPDKLAPSFQYFPYSLRPIDSTNSTTATTFPPEASLTTFVPLTTIHFDLTTEVSTSYLPSPGETSPATTMPAPTRSSLTEDTTVPSLSEDTTVPSLSEDTTMPFASVHPPLLPALRGPPVKPTTFSKFFTTLGATDMKAGKERSEDTPVDKQIKGQMTPKSYGPASTLSKAQAWVRNRQWTTTLAPDSSTSARNSGTAARMLRTVQMTLSSQTGYTEDLLHEDKAGFLYVSVPSSLYTIIPTRSTVAGDVLFSADKFTATTQALTGPNREFHKMMYERDEGYVIVFLIEITRLVALKEEEDVQEVISHSELIINKYLEEGKLGFAGDEIKNAAIFLSRLMTESKFNLEILRSHAVMMHMLLNERGTSLSPEVNSLIDYADMLFDDAQGDALFDAVREFEAFPNSTKTAWQICQDLLEHFIEPFRVVASTERGHRLIDTLNKALTDRWGQVRGGYRKWRGDLRMLGGGATPKLNLSRVIKRYTLSLKRKISMNRRRHINRTNPKTNDTYRRQYQTPWSPLLRSMLPITSHQKRFRVITPRQLRSNAYLNIERPTKEFYYRRRLSAPTHPPNEMLQFFPQVPLEMKRAKHLKQSINHRRTRRLKAQLIRRSSKTQGQK